MTTLKLIWAWLIKYPKIVLSGLGVLSAIIFGVGWHLKNKKIDRLQFELYLSKAKIQLEALATKYATTMGDLKVLREKDKNIDMQIAGIESALQNKLPEDMTAEEIAKKFNDIGIRPPSVVSKAPVI